MSVMTAGERKRRAGSAHGRRLVTAVPGQPNVMAGPCPGAGERHGRAVRGEQHGRTARGAPARARRPGTAGAAETPPSATRVEAALPSAARAPVPRPTAAPSPVARQGLTRSPIAKPGMAQSESWPSVARPRVARVGVARSPGAGARPARTRVRLTRRGRIVVTGLVIASVLLVAALAWLAGTARADAAGSGVPSSAVYHSLHSVTVLPGQSLWSIATQYEPGSDPRNVIQEIIDLNALSGTSVQPGEQLWLPRG
jgi:LysM domain